MEIQLQELIDQIKKDGVNEAEAAAEKIIADANKKAEKILAEAQNKAEKMIADAKAQNEKVERSSEDAIRQAGRNLLISFRESVAREVTAILGEQVNAVYSKENFSELIKKVILQWNKNTDAEDLTILLNSDDLKAVEENVLAALKEKAGNGITFYANDNFDGGFRVAINNGSAYYDYSAEAVTEMLSSFLNPKVTALLKEAE